MRIATLLLLATVVLCLLVTVCNASTAKSVKNNKKQQKPKKNIINEDNEDNDNDKDKDELQFTSREDLDTHVKQLNQKMKKSSSSSSSSNAANKETERDRATEIELSDLSKKYNMFPDEEPVSDFNRKELKREEMRRRLSVQETLDEFGRLSVEHAKALHMYGGNLHKQQRFDELFLVARELVSIHEALDGPEHFHTGRALDNLGSVAYRVKEEEICEHAMKRALFIFIQKYGAKSKEVLLLRGRMLTFRVKDAETTGGLSYEDYQDEL